ncbi:MAG: hypothetical protein E7643_04510 [Ruminococcaceae bacterium]|nr:hypothetical protein [Oscillospiraceae bacterium]
MAQFTNTARLSYNDTVINSNVATGEILEALSASKTAIMDDYARNDEITYVISALNSGSTPITGLTVTDDLGAYPFGEQTLVPLSLVENSVHLYINGVLQPTPNVTAGPPLTVSGITLPPNSNLLLIYEAEANSFAPLGDLGSIVNTATLTGTGLPTPVTVSETVVPAQEPLLTITKSVEPAVITENGTVNYRFIIQNVGNTAADEAASVVVSDTFDPVLSNLTVTFNGETWAEGVNYTYVATDGEFATVAGRVSVPAASFAQDPTTGEWIITPGVSVLTVTGTV